MFEFLGSAVGIGIVVLPLAASALASWSERLDARHNNALARIVGMAGREAATIAVALNSLPPGGNLSDKQVQSQLIAASVGQISNEMSQSIGITGASSEHLTKIVLGELSKLLIPAPTAVAVAA